MSAAVQNTAIRILSTNQNSTSETPHWLIMMELNIVTGTLIKFMLQQITIILLFMFDVGQLFPNCGGLDLPATLAWVGGRGS